MIATHSKATKAAIPVARVNKADRMVKQAQGAVIQETRDSRAEQVVAVNKDSRVSKDKVNREVCLIVIARDSKAICPTVTESRANRKKLLQSGMVHLMMMTRTQTDLKDTDSGMSNR